jgi:hypothetical protein
MFGNLSLFFTSKNTAIFFLKKINYFQTGSFFATTDKQEYVLIGLQSAIFKGREAS